MTARRYMEDDMAILDTVKLAARIKHNSLDSEITRLIAWTRSEMERAGVPAAIASSENNTLTTECTVQGVLMHIATDEKIRDAAEKSFLFQLDNLRKHIWPEPDPDPDPDPEPDPDPDPEPEPEPEPEPDGGDPNDP